MLLLALFLLGNAGSIVGEIEKNPSEFLEEGPGALDLPAFVPGPIFRGSLFGSTFNSFLHLLASIAPLRLTDLFSHVIIPDILTVISPTHGIAEDILVDVPTVIFHVIPDFLLLIAALLLIPVRIILFPLFLLGLPFRILFEGIGNLYRKISVQPKFIIRLRLWLNKIFRRPFFARLKNLFYKVRLELRKIRDLIRPNIITVLVKGVLGFILGVLTGVIPRIRNFFLKLQLFIRKLLTPGVFGIFKPFGPALLLRLELFLKKLIRPGFFRLIRPVPLLERLRFRLRG